MKIICIDNYARVSISDSVVAEHVPDHYVKTIVNVLNEKHGGGSSSDYFKAVDNDYKLYVFQP